MPGPRSICEAALPGRWRGRWLGATPGPWQDARPLDRKPLVAHLRAQFRLDWSGIHGVAHWVRVRSLGLRLAERTTADPTVVELFAWLHDARRRNDGRDRHHGDRAADLAVALNGRFFDLDDHRLGLLVTACQGHSGGSTEGDITVQTCWDADRLDLGRIGIRPEPSRLCTDAARDDAMIRWAWARSRRWAAKAWR